MNKNNEAIQPEMGGGNGAAWFVFVVLFIAAVMMCTSSCKTCQPCITESTKSDSTSLERDTNRTEKMSVDTFWKLMPVPGPVQYMPSPCDLLCDSNGKLKPYSKKANKNGMTSHTYTKGDSLINDCNADSLLMVKETIEKQTNIRERLYHQELEKQVIKNEMSKWKQWWASTYKWGFWILLALVLLYLFRKIWAAYLIQLIKLP